MPARLLLYAVSYLYYISSYNLMYLKMLSNPFPFPIPFIRGE